jgi:predicted transcriptional regulator
MKASKMMRKVFSVVAVGSLVLSVPVAAQDVDIAKLERKASKFDKLTSRLNHYSTQRTYSSGLKEGAADQREIDRLQNKFETTGAELLAESAKKIKQLGDEYTKKAAAATSADEVKRLNDEYQKAADLLEAEQKQKMDQQLSEITEDIKIVSDAQNLNLICYEYELRMKAAPYKTEQLQREFNRRVNTYLKENGYAE